MHPLLHLRTASWGRAARFHMQVFELEQRPEPGLRLVLDRKEMGIAAGIDFQVPQTGTRLFDTLTRPH